MLLTNSNCNSLNTIKSIQNGLGYPSGHMLQKSRSNLHLLLHNCSHTGIVYGAVQIIRLNSNRCIRLYSHIHSEPSPNHSLLRLRTMICIEPQTFERCVLLLYFHNYASMGLYLGTNSFITVQPIR